MMDNQGRDGSLPVGSTYLFTCTGSSTFSRSHKMPVAVAAGAVKMQAFPVPGPTLQDRGFHSSQPLASASTRKAEQATGVRANQRSDRRRRPGCFQLRLPAMPTATPPCTCPSYRQAVTRRRVQQPESCAAMIFQSPSLVAGPYMQYLRAARCKTWLRISAQRAPAPEVCPAQSHVMPIVAHGTPVRLAHRHCPRSPPLRGYPGRRCIAGVPKSWNSADMVVLPAARVQ